MTTIRPGWPGVPYRRSGSDLEWLSARCVVRETRYSRPRSIPYQNVRASVLITRPSKESHLERRSSGPSSFGEIIAEIARDQHLGPSLSDRHDHGVSTAPAPQPMRVVARPSSPDDPDWLLHESQLLRHPVYRTERADAEDDPPGSYFDQPTADQLPLLTYEYDPETTVISRIGELGTRDMLVMAVLSQAFFANDCPADNKIHGDHATMGYIARQLGMHPEGATRLIRSSIERLSTARVKIKLHDSEKLTNGDSKVTRGEVTIGFLSNFGWRERKQKGVAVKRDNFIQLDQAMADLIRIGQFTFLRAEVLRALRRQPLALKLYAWARTHRPDDRGHIFYGVSRLTRQLGCSDQNSTRRRKKLIDAVEAVCAAAPEEFLGYELRQGRSDHVVVLRKAKHRGPSLASQHQHTVGSAI